MGGCPKVLAFLSMKGILTVLSNSCGSIAAIQMVYATHLPLFPGNVLWLSSGAPASTCLLKGKNIKRSHVGLGQWPNTPRHTVAKT